MHDDKKRSRISFISFLKENGAMAYHDSHGGRGSLYSIATDDTADDRGSESTASSSTCSGGSACGCLNGSSSSQRRRQQQQQQDRYRLPMLSEQDQAAMGGGPDGVPKGKGPSSFFRALLFRRKTKSIKNQLAVVGLKKALLVGE